MVEYQYSPIYDIYHSAVMATEYLLHTIRYGIFMCAQKLTRWPA